MQNVPCLKLISLFPFGPLKSWHLKLVTDAPLTPYLPLSGIVMVMSQTVRQPNTLPSAFTLLARMWALPAIARYLLVGVAATLVHYFVLKALLLLGTSVAIANPIGFLIALNVTYFGNRYFAFTAKFGHMKSFLGVAFGAVAGAFLHTATLIGLTNGMLIEFITKHIGFLGALWQWILDALPSGISGALIAQSPAHLSTGFAFLIACFAAMLLTYSWNRYVVFQQRSA